MPLVTPGSPAERAGIKPGDVIIGAYSKLVQLMTFTALLEGGVAVSVRARYSDHKVVPNHTSSVLNL